MIFRDRNTRGFTLIELMCSMVIASIILILAVAMLRASGDGYERIGGNVECEREGRTLVNQLAADLSSARFHKDFMIEKSTHDWPVGRLGFLTLQPMQAQSDVGRAGDLCAVVYYIKNLTIGGRATRCVMRGFRESAETFHALINDDVPSLYRERDNIDEPIAIGVVSFEVCPKSRDTSGKWIDWTANSLIGPDAIDLRVVIARRNLAGKLKTPEDWDGAGLLIGDSLNAGRNENLEVYSAMIRFGSHERR